MELAVGGYSLKNLNKINILLGKNGCGKSTLLRSLEASRTAIPDIGNFQYLSPERGGSLVSEPSIEQSLMQDPEWLLGQRRNNQTPNFRQQSAGNFRKLKDIVQDEIESDYGAGSSGNVPKFQTYIDQINSLLEQIEIKRHNSSFKIYKKETIDEISPSSISSGEAELISLGIEILIFSKGLVQGKANLLLMDEPDVHLHPDLQVRLMKFLQTQVENNDFSIIMATHSTPILGALQEYADTHIAFMASGQTDFEFSPINEIYRNILPVFGAHPLSNIFNESPILLVEGEDDERIWQQAIRTSQGRIKLFPRVCGSITEIGKYEKEVKKIIGAIYQGAKAYSLRDRDGIEGELADDLPVIRFRLECRNAESLLLSDEVLSALGESWETIQEKIKEWISLYSSTPHKSYAAMKQFQDEGFDRKNYNLKDLRNLLMGIIGSKKDWETAIGQVVGNTIPTEKAWEKEGSIFNYLGEKLTKTLLYVRSENDTTGNQ